MIIELSHIASSDGTKCIRCKAVFGSKKPFPTGARVGMIVAALTEVSTCYQINQATRETPPQCQYRP